jgi:VWFA-related protein
MSARVRPIAAALAIVATFLPARAQTPPPARAAQVIRTGVDVVMVDVTVRDDGRAVTGLRAGDFVVTDNGVRQRVESVEATAVPIDLTLVVDLSGNPRAPAKARVPRLKVIAEIDREVRAIAKMLRPDDRLRVLAVDRRVHQLLPMAPVASLTAIDRAEFDDLSALYDTLAAALLQPVEPARRHVVVARTKGLDTISSIDAQAVRAIAERSDALFHVVVMETALDNDIALSGFQCEFMGLCWPGRRFWVPFQHRLVGSLPTHPLSPDGQALAAGADATGGGLHKTAVFTEPTLTGTFRRAFEDFRSSYVLRYTPAGGALPGWHAIEVKVAGSKSYTVRARTGYLVEGAPAPPPPVLIPDVPKTLAQLTAAYERAAFRPVVVGLRQAADPGRLLRDFVEGGNPWPAAPRKEAAFALELVEPALFSPRAATREAAYDMLARFSRLIRHPLEPDVFERYWHFAALTLLEGSIRPGPTEAFVARALERFPDEPRFILSRAIATDQRWGTHRDTPVVDAGGTPTPEHADTVRRYYEAAIQLPPTAVEARIRFAFFLYRTGRHEEAFGHLTAAGTTSITDPSLRYLRQLILGHVLWALDRRDGAVDAYRGALAVAQAAQSARVALMNALLMRGDRDAAQALGEQIQSEAADELDPWWMYWQGQYRLQPQAMARVRELSR